MTRPLFPVWTLLMALGLAVGCGSESSPPTPGEDPAAPIAVAATVPPLAWLAEAVGGDAVEVTVIVPPGASAEHHEPSPRRMIALADAELVLAVGHPALDFEVRFLEPEGTAETRPQARLTLADHVPPERLLAEDPHLWTSPRLLAAGCQPLGEALAALRPASGDELRDRATATRRQLETLDRQLARRFAELPGRRFWVAHPAWGWLARSYDLQQVALEEHGREPSPARLVELLEQARGENVRVLFVQRGASAREARAVADSIGARVETLDPLAADWPENLLRVADALEDALGIDPDPASTASGSTESPAETTP